MKIILVQAPGPELLQGVVYLHAVDLASQTGINPERLFLSPGEDPALRMKKVQNLKKLRDDYLLKVLTACTGTEITRNDLLRSASGKPHIRDNRRDLHFSIAYSGSFMALGWAAGAEVGVDAEKIEDLGNLLEMGAYMSDAYLHWLLSIREPDRSQAFFGYWTTNEAIFKCAGTGIGDGFISPEEIVENSGRVNVGGMVTAYQRIDLYPGYAGCIAAQCI